MGIPLCEGSCALAGSVALVMILYGASQWLNYDLFGLFVAARQVGRFLMLGDFDVFCWFKVGTSTMVLNGVTWGPYKRPYKYVTGVVSPL